MRAPLALLTTRLKSSNSRERPEIRSRRFRICSSRAKGSELEAAISRLIANLASSERLLKPTVERKPQRREYSSAVKRKLTILSFCFVYLAAMLRHWAHTFPRCKHLQPKQTAPQTVQFANCFCYWAFNCTMNVIHSTSESRTYSQQVVL